MIRNDALPSKLTLYLRRFYYYIKNERFSKKFNYDWNKTQTRFDIINKLIYSKKFKSYLEIGCQSDVNFSKIKIENKVGVDPQSGGTLRMTSDEFFSQNKETFDLIFIDGLHIHEQVLKDIDNSLNVLNESGVILLHDCLPAKIWHQTIPQTHSSWNGDVWKSIVQSRTREDIDTYTIKADQGLGLILKRKNRDILVHQIDNFKDLKFEDYYKHHEKFMRLVDEDKFLEII